VDIDVLVQVRKSRTGPELSTTDVDPRWYAAHVPARQRNPLPSRPLSATLLRLDLVVPAGRRTTRIVVPTVVDGRDDPGERLTLAVEAITSESVGVPLSRVTGTVADARQAWRRSSTSFAASTSGPYAGVPGW
jgi:hypothetical protein